MFTNFFKLAFRNIRKNKAFSMINILGLTIGLASCMLIGLYVYNEISFDRFHQGHDRIYRINKLTNEKGKQASRNGITPGQLAPALEKELPEVQAAARYRPWFNDMLVTADSVRLKLKDVCYADQGFLEVFDFPLLSGKKSTALSEPFTAVITQTTASKYFGNSNPLGKTMITLNNIPIKITGVAMDPPENSSMQFSMLISWPTTSAQSTADYFFWMNNWLTQVDFSFVKLKTHVNTRAVEAKISTILHAHLPEREYEYKLYLQPLDDIHLQSAGIQYADSFHTNNGKLVYVLLIISGFILLIACFNFINLTTASALGRAKETGIQKVMGAQQGQLIAKYFSESLLLCSISFLLAILLSSILLPPFNQLAGSHLQTGLFGQLNLILLGLGTLLLISLIAGLYPALFMASFKSTDVFRNVVKAGKDNWLRKTLVTSQFALSILLIIATLVVKNQMHFLVSKDLGFDKEQMVVIQLANTGLENKSNALISAWKQDPGIASISSSNRVPGQSFNGYGIVPEGFRLEDHLMSSVLETDADFQSTYKIPMEQGRYFSSEQPSDTASAIVINQAMARYLNWRSPVGKQFEIYEAMKGKVIGVMKDFNVTSLREHIEPLAIMLRSNPLQVSIRLKPGTTQASLDFLRKTWKQFEPVYPFDYFFMDEQMNQFYQSDIRLLQVLGIFAGLAICIACLGLLGLSIYTAKQRTKEIGIRKVLGAGLLNIAVLMSGDFLKLVLIAAVISFPIAWWALNSWLADFAFRVHIDPWVFMIAGISVLLIALLTISFQSIKAALANPVKSLRSE